MVEPLRLHIGGKQQKEGWKILNINPGRDVDFLGDIRNLGQFADASCEAVYCSHVLEHIRQRDVVATLRGIYRVLAPGGRLMISVPNLDVLCALFVNPTLDLQSKYQVMRMIYGGDVDDHDLHHVGFNEPILRFFLGEAGFRHVERLVDFDLFDDTSRLRFGNVPISLNVQATKSNDA